MTINLGEYLEKLHFDEGMPAIDDFVKIPTGFDKLDKCLGDGIPRGLTVLGATPNIGKSTIMFQIANNMAKMGYPVLIFSMEMSKIQIIAKAISRESYIAHKRSGSIPIRTDELMNRHKLEEFYNGAERESIISAVNTLSSAMKNVYIEEWDSTQGNIEAIIEKANAFKKEHEKENPIIMIDYLQILTTKNTYTIDKLRIDYILDAINSIKTQIPVFLISALNRASYTRSADMSSFKDSGNIEYSADVLLTLEYTEKSIDEKHLKEFLDEQKKRTPRKLSLSVIKQRFGETGVTLNFDYYSAYNLFVPEGYEISSDGVGLFKVEIDEASVDEMKKIADIFAALKLIDEKDKER